MNKAGSFFKLNIPEELIQDFKMDTAAVNICRMLVIAIILLIYETFVFFLVPAWLNNLSIIEVFIVASLVFLPFLWLGRKKAGQWNANVLMFIVYAYLAVLIAFILALTLNSQGFDPQTYLYIFLVFGISIFLYLRPLASIIFNVSTFAVFAALLPYYQADPMILQRTYVNILVVHIISIAANRMNIGSRVAIFKDRFTIEEQNRRLFEQAQRDLMTGMLNHAVSIESLDDEITRANRIGYPLTIMLLDIDNFKRLFVDTCG